MSPLNILPTKMLPLYPKYLTPTMTPSNPTTMLELWAWMASTLASFMFIWAMFRQFLPYELRHFFEKRLNNFYSRLHPYVAITIPENSGNRLTSSGAYNAIQNYLSTLSSSTSARRLVGEIGLNGKDITLSLGINKRIEDEFQGVKIWWVSGKISSSNSKGPHFFHHESDKRFFKVVFHQKDRNIVTGKYLKHVVKSGKKVKIKKRQRKLYTNGGSSRRSLGMWSHIPFEHPASFESLAMNPEKKREIMDDLLKFKQSKKFYAKIGKAWKRGYLLFGPPGSGKSTMIAAMANLLKYDVYDLELTAVQDNTELRRLLIDTTSKSIIVIEDIDCSLDLTGQRKKMKTGEVNVEQGITLSGLLNFIDGIWSSSGEERIVVFTTNYVERLDPALIRRGRMDKHIEMGYCGFEGFKILVKNYLGIDEHAMFEEIKEFLSEVEMTPADVAENLMPKSPEDHRDDCLQSLVMALMAAKMEVARKKEEEIGREMKKMVEEESRGIMGIL